MIGTYGGGDPAGSFLVISTLLRTSDLRDFMNLGDRGSVPVRNHGPP